MKTGRIRLAGWFALASSLGVGLAQDEATATHFVHGRWFDGNRFVTDDFYAVGGALRHHVPPEMKVITVDLKDGFVVPPYGDAHEHNFDGRYGIEQMTALCLKDGVFYVQDMTNTPEGAREVKEARLVNTPVTVDVSYANGGITGVNGHPKEIYEALELGIYPATNEAQKKKITESHQQADKAYWEIDSAADLEAKWPRILATKPELIKIYLLGSEDYTADSHLHPVLGLGLDPMLVPLITAKAHAAGLKVAAHVDTATDYHVALLGGVDEMAHLPGYFVTAKEDASRFRLTDADIALTAKRQVAVQATAGIDVVDTTPAEDLAALKKIEVDNLGRLKAEGVRVVVGSDAYAADSVHEADFLQGLGVWTNLEMLRMWSVTTPKDIFPQRKIGELKDGYEASFLVLQGDPLKDWDAVHRIADRWKQGQELDLKQAK